MSGEYKGSQAYAHDTGPSESVNRNTGSVGYCKTLVDLRGITKANNLSIGVKYSEGLSGCFGLPQNWTFSIPFIIPGQSVTTQGRTYAIDPNWADATGYHSGLRYVNNHGIKFERIIPSQALPSGRPGQYGWQFRMTDGVIDYYDDAGKLLEHADVYGNSVYYRYVDQQAGPQTAKIQYIQDSWGQVVQFGYQPGEEIRITTPDGGQTHVFISNLGIQYIVDAVQNRTLFTYESISSRRLLSTIQHPSGLQVRLVYQKLNYIDVSGIHGSLPAVRSHYRLDANGKFVSRTDYQFGTATNGSTFTGFNANYRMGGLQDSLMDGNNQLYRYDTLVSNLDQDGNIRSASRILYNYLHLPMQEFHYAIISQNQLSPAYQAIYSYDIPINQHARTTNYSLPYMTEQLHYNATLSPPSYEHLRFSTAKYDDFGSLLETCEQMWDPTLKSYTKQKHTLSTYTKTSWGGQMLQSEVFIDDVSGFQKQIRYTLTADQKNIQSSTVQFKTNLDKQFRPFKTKTLAYDKNGRVLTETVGWSNGVSTPPGSVSSYTNTNSYQFDPKGFETVAAKDPQGNATYSTYDLRAFRGPLVLKILPLGQSESFEYDLIGRCISYTDPLGHNTTNTYTIGSTGNSVTSTNSLGYVTREYFDCRGLSIELSDNGDPTLPPSPEPTRILSQATYDALSQPTSKTDELGLKTIYGPYDSFNRILSSIDPHGNHETIVYDDSLLTIQTSLNGDLRSKSHLDSFARNISTASYADSGDPTITYSLIKNSTYDGYSNLTQTSLLQQPLNGSPPSQLELSSNTYTVENAICKTHTSTKTDLEEDAYDSLEREIQYDLFGQVYTTTKTVTFHDGRSFRHEGAVSLFDSCNLLVLHRNQLGQEEKYTYDANGRMASLTRFDGTQTEYTYDAIGRLISAANGTQKLAKSYLGNGRISQVQSGEGTVWYRYSLDGACLAVRYPDGAEQKYVLDRTGRIVEEVDAVGAVRKYTFTPLNQISTRSLGPDTLSYHYGISNHSNNQLLSSSITGTRLFTRTLSYDGFGRPNHVTVRDSHTLEIILDAIYLYNAKGKLCMVELSSESLPSTPELNSQRRMLYDGLGQLREEITVEAGSGGATVVEFEYDGNANVTSITTDGNKQLRTYNDIDQRVDPGFGYDVNGRLISDDEGREFSYEANDQLCSVRVKGGETSFQYYPTGAMRVCKSGAEESILYYNGGSVNATKTKTSGAHNDDDETKSYLLEPGRRIAAYDNDNSATYFLETQDSTALQLGPADASKSSSYHAYGSLKSPPAQQNLTFGFHQEPTNPASTLIYLRTRHYHPSLPAFLTPDPTTSKENTYAFSAGDPINNIDPTGHAETALLASTAVSFAVTTLTGLATGGIAALIFGPEDLLASIAAASLSGAAGSLAGDGTQAAVSHDHFSGQRAAEDLFSGALGGAVGAGSGGSASRAAMAASFERGCSQRAVTAIGTVTAGSIGGASGGFAASGSMALMNGDSPFTSATALSAITGAFAGLGGGILESGCYLGIASRNIMPVPATARDFPCVLPAENEGGWHPKQRLVSFCPQAEANRDVAWFARNGFPREDMLRLGGGGRGEMYETVLVHGAGRTVFPTVGRMEAGGMRVYMRPMKGRLFAEYLRGQGWGADAVSGAPIKFASCFGAWGNAQELANVLQRDVFAGYGFAYADGRGLAGSPFLH